MTTSSPAPGWDVLIAGGTVVDGAGGPAVVADVALSGDQIAAVGPGLAHRPEAADSRTVDATDRIVTPGFIDLHTHADFTVLGTPAAQTQLAQGVTSIVTGNCGQAPFPLPASPDAPWTDARGFGAAVVAARPAVNVGLQAAHNAIRAVTMGHDDRPPTDDELARMCAAVTDAAAAPGVVGFSTGLIYLPGRFADRGEIDALARAAADGGLLYSTHLRNEADDLRDAVAEAIATAESTGVRLEISHLKAMGPGNHGLVSDALSLIDAARERGVDVTADVYPYTASSTDLSSRLPGWAVDGGREALLERLADPTVRTRVAAEFRSRFGRDVDPDGILVAAMPHPDFERFVGQSLTSIGDALGLSAEEAAMQLLVAGGGGVGIVNHAMAEDDVRTVLAHPQTAVASDGWILATAGDDVPHPRSFGTFARILARYTDVDGYGGLLPLPEAVRKMTSLPASRIGITDRGVLAPGMKADVAVVDPATVGDVSTYHDPWQLAHGVCDVFVNGVHAWADGAATDARGGVLLERSSRS